jgi:hypothetical protein
MPLFGQNPAYECKSGFRCMPDASTQNKLQVQMHLLMHPTIPTEEPLPTRTKSALHCKQASNLQLHNFAHQQAEELKTNLDLHFGFQANLALQHGPMWNP